MKTNPSAKEMVQIDLLRRSSGGDAVSFKKLYDFSSPQVYNYLSNMLQVRTVIDAAFLETYQNVWKNAKNYRPTLKVSIWILGIARSIAKQKMEHPDVKELISQHKNSEYNNTITDTIDQETWQREALRNLDPYHREILGLILMPHTTYPDIAKLLNLPLQQVKTDVFTAKLAYKKNLVLDSTK
ncbi:MAG: DUF1776 domain-containing protein [Gammaproteobacteria bacterium]|nr:DUF1776 domain-containing protein [Gammaproteobacteria bacterium]